MNHRFGREFLGTPGPTNVPDDVLSAMHRPATDIYSGPLVEMTDSCLDDLKKIFRTEGQTYIYISNGHGSWESALTNVLSRGEKILVLPSGGFANRWGEMADFLGLETEALDWDWRRAVNPDEVEARLRRDKSGEIKAILVVQVDTASGVVNDISKIRAAIDNAGHGALLLVDAIASLGTMPFEMDEWGVDVAVTGSQKGLMMPPGLSFMAAGRRAMEAHRKADMRTRYWDWTARHGSLHYEKYCGTPPVNQLFGLRAALDMILEEGLDEAIRRHRLLAEASRQAVKVWSEEGELEFNILDPRERSNSVTVVLIGGNHDSEMLLDYCNQKGDLVLGIGILGLKNKAFRIAHMGHVNAPMILGALSVIEMGLVALNIPHGKGGVGAAIEYLGKQVS